MRKLKVGVVDILSKSANKKAWSRFIRASNMSIMTQVVAVWCEELGHDVQMAYYDGPVVMSGQVSDDADIVFINAYSHSAQLAYALSQYFRSKGACTVIGGPHPRAYPDDSVKYFDYAVGFCDKELIEDILLDCSAHRPLGQYLSRDHQPKSLPGVVARWKYMKQLLDEARFLRVVPMIGSLGCPYTCSFCVDSVVPYQPLDYESLKADLRFIQAQKLPRTMIGWHDPNFGVRFDDYMNVIEEAAPPGTFRFGAESSLAILKEDGVKRMAKSGFKVIMPGVESWYEVGDKSRMRSSQGLEKVRGVADHVNMITSHIPYLQANFIFGLDSEEGPEPFELTKQFIDLAPRAYPLFSLLTSYGRNAPLNLEYQRNGRVLNIPFHFLNQIHSMNVRPLNYSWHELYTLTTDLLEYAYSTDVLRKRFFATSNTATRFEQLLRGTSSGRKFRLRNHREMRDRLTRPEVQRFFDGETSTLPDFFVEPIKRDLDWLWEWLPEGALNHDQNAYLNSVNGTASDIAARPPLVLAET